MNILKITFIAIVGMLVGYTATQFISQADTASHDDTENTYCHQDGYDFDHFLERFSEADQVIILAERDRLLTVYEVTLEDLETDYDMRHQLMEDLWDFIDDQAIEFEDTYAYPRHGHMWR
ncbi:MAG: hypothetical protein K9L26_02370 [Candidatus Izimaplasma sp.]|nr:hypothetical protein [Candidatus Izimaplasma bacterium]